MVLKQLRASESVREREGEREREGVRERGREVIGVLSFFFLSRSLLDSVKERTSRLAKSCHSFLSSFPLAGTLMALHRLQRQAPH